jgi:hypothetical protein
MQDLDGQCGGWRGIARARDAGQPVTKPDEKAAAQDFRIGSLRQYN